MRKVTYVSCKGLHIYFKSRNLSKNSVKWLLICSTMRKIIFRFFFDILACVYKRYAGNQCKRKNYF